jgi:DNA-directed RNA polymerase beta subunit
MATDTSLYGRINWFADQDTQIAWQAQRHAKRDPTIETKLCSSVMKSYMRQVDLVAHQTESMDYVLAEMIPKLVKSYTITAFGQQMIHRLKFIDLLYIPPNEVVDDKTEQHGVVTPFDARLKNGSYQATLVIRILSVFACAKNVPYDTL